MALAIHFSLSRCALCVCVWLHCVLSTRVSEMVCPIPFVSVSIGCFSSDSWSVSFVLNVVFADISGLLLLVSVRPGLYTHSFS